MKTLRELIEHNEKAQAYQDSLTINVLRIGVVATKFN